jgi:hypothetical protein
MSVLHFNYNQQVREGEMGKKCRTNRKDAKGMQNFSPNTYKERRAAEIRVDLEGCFLNEAKGKVCDGLKQVQLTQNECVGARQ